MHVEGDDLYLTHHLPPHPHLPPTHPFIRNTQDIPAYVQKSLKLQQFELRT